MDAYGIVASGGKQYLVKPGDTLRVERMPAAAGDEVSLSPVLAVSDGQRLQIGTPQLDGATVTAVVLDHIRGPKLVAFKRKRRKGYSRKTGHRQELTVLRIKGVSPAGTAEPAPPEAQGD